MHHPESIPIRILLIEDNPNDARLLQALLAGAEGAAFHLECADRLAAGLARLTAGEHDVVLLDLSLPDSQGFEAFTAVHRQAPDVPIVILSGSEDEALALKTVQAGAQDYLVKGQYSERELGLLTSIGQQIAVAIQNARLFEEEKRRTTQLGLINEVGKKTASILDLDKLMPEVTRSIQERFNYYNVALFLLDEECREVVMQAVAGGFEHTAPGEYRQSVDEGIIGFVARTGKSWLTSDVSQDPYYVKGFLAEVLTKSELCIPVKLGDKIIGALDVQSIHLNDFDQSDVTAMEAVAVSGSIFSCSRIARYSSSFSRRRFPSSSWSRCCTTARNSCWTRLRTPRPTRPRKPSSSRHLLPCSQ